VFIGYLWAERSGLSDWLHKTRYSVAVCEDPLAHTVSQVCSWFIMKGVVTTEDDSN